MSYVVYEIKDVLDALSWLGLKMDALLLREGELAKTLNESVTELQANFANLSEDNDQLKAASAAVVALLNGLVAQNAAFKDQIAELIALSPTPDQLAKLEEINAGLAAQDADIDASVKTLTDATAAS